MKKLKGHFRQFLRDHREILYINAIGGIMLAWFLAFFWLGLFLAVAI